MSVPLNQGDRLVIATHNRGKLAEFDALLGPHGFSTVSAGELGLPEPEETGVNFVDNARLKARTAARASGLTAIADDSGLAVDALNGDPGVFSARWAGEARDFNLAMREVNDKLAAAGAREAAQRGARFRSVICLAAPDGSSEHYEGDVHGHIVWPPRGSGGFGYDPVFVPDGDTRTFAEMSAAEKLVLSHRARAFEKFAAARLGA